MLFLLLKEPVKEPRFDQGSACDASKFCGAIKFLEHMRRHDYVETPGCQARPSPTGLAEPEFENAFAFIEAPVSFLDRHGNVALFSLPAYASAL